MTELTFNLGGGLPSLPTPPQNGGVLAEAEALSQQGKINDALELLAPFRSQSIAAKSLSLKLEAQIQTQNAFLGLNLLAAFFSQSDNSEIPEPLQHLATALSENKKLSLAFDRLSAKDQEAIRLKVGAEHLAEIFSISENQNSESFYTEALHLGIHLKQEAQLNAAGGILSFVANTSTELKPQAEVELNAMLGKGEIARRFEFLTGHFAKDCCDLKTIAPMLAGTAVGQLTSTALLGRFAGLSQNFLTRGLGARFLAGTFGYFAEVSTFALSGRALSGGEGPIGDDFQRAGLTIGALKLFSFLGNQAFLKIHGFNEWGIPTQLSYLSKFTQVALPQTAMFSGMMVSHKLEEALKLRPHVDDATTVTDTLASMLSMEAGAHLGHAVLGDGFAQFQKEMGVRTDIFTSSGIKKESHAQSQLNSSSVFQNTLRSFALQNPLTWIVMGVGSGGGLPHEGKGKESATPDYYQTCLNLIEKLRSPNRDERLTTLWHLGESAKKLKESAPLSSLAEILEGELAEPDPSLCEVTIWALERMLPFLEEKVARRQALAIAQRLLDESKGIPLSDISTLLRILPHLDTEFRNNLLAKLSERLGYFTDWEKERINAALDFSGAAPFFQNLLGPPEQTKQEKLPKDPDAKVRILRTNIGLEQILQRTSDELLQEQVNDPQGRAWNRFEPFDEADKDSWTEPTDRRQPLSFFPETSSANWREHALSLSDPEFFLPSSLEGSSGASANEGSSTKRTPKMAEGSFRLTSLRKFILTLLEHGNEMKYMEIWSAFQACGYEGGPSSVFMALRRMAELNLIQSTKTKIHNKIFQNRSTRLYSISENGKKFLSERKDEKSRIRSESKLGPLVALLGVGLGLDILLDPHLAHAATPIATHASDKGFLGLALGLGLLGMAGMGSSKGPYSYRSTGSEELAPLREIFSSHESSVEAKSVALRNYRLALSEQRQSRSGDLNLSLYGEATALCNFLIDTHVSLREYLARSWSLKSVGEYLRDTTMLRSEALDSLLEIAKDLSFKDPRIFDLANLLSVFVTRNRGVLETSPSLKERTIKLFEQVELRLSDHRSMSKNKGILTDAAEYVREKRFKSVGLALIDERPASKVRLGSVLFATLYNHLATTLLNYFIPHACEHFYVSIPIFILSFLLAERSEGRLFKRKNLGFPEFTQKLMKMAEESEQEPTPVSEAKQLKEIPEKNQEKTRIEIPSTQAKLRVETPAEEPLEPIQDKKITTPQKKQRGGRGSGGAGPLAAFIAAGVGLDLLLDPRLAHAATQVGEHVSDKGFLGLALGLGLLGMAGIKKLSEKSAYRDGPRDSLQDFRATLKDKDANFEAKMAALESSHAMISENEITLHKDPSYSYYGEALALCEFLNNPNLSLLDYLSKDMSLRGIRRYYRDLTLLRSKALDSLHLVLRNLPSKDLQTYSIYRGVLRFVKKNRGALEVLPNYKERALRVVKELAWRFESPLSPKQEKKFFREFLHINRMKSISDVIKNLRNEPENIPIIFKMYRFTRFNLVAGWFLYFGLLNKFEAFLPSGIPSGLLMGLTSLMLGRRLTRPLDRQMELGYPFIMERLLKGAPDPLPPELPQELSEAYELFFEPPKAKEEVTLVEISPPLAPIQSITEVARKVAKLNPKLKPLRIETEASPLPKVRVEEMEKSTPEPLEEENENETGETAKKGD